MKEYNLNSSTKTIGSKVFHAQFITEKLSRCHCPPGTVYCRSGVNRSGTCPFCKSQDETEYELNSSSKILDGKVFHAQFIAQPMTRDDHTALLQLLLPLSQQLLKTTSAGM